MLAETLADLRRLLELLIGKPVLIPGAVIEEIQPAWRTDTGPELEKLIQRLTGSADQDQLPYADLQDGRLVGASGKLKRTFFRGLYDNFLNIFTLENRTRDDNKRAVDFGADAIEAGAIMVSSIPGYHGVVEFLTTTKLAMRSFARLI